jgi:hypothetical protein
MHLGIRVTRDIRTASVSLGVVELDLPDDSAGYLPFGYSCEDPERATKIKGQTAIPVGTYAVRLYDSPKHGRDTPELVNVPGFAHIQIHSGNTVADTEGCLLFGLARDVPGERVLRSRPACEWLRGEVVRTIRAGGTVSVEIRQE